MPGEPANLSRYSSVNQEMQTDSTSASSGLSMGLPARSVCWKAGMVLRIMPMVEITTNSMLMEDIAFAAPEVSGFSRRSHKNFWYGTKRPAKWQICI